MAREINVLEAIVTEALLSALALRFDICTCRVCRGAMVSQALTQLSPVNADPSAITSALIQETKALHHRSVRHACREAIDSVAEKPPHIILEDKKEGFRLLSKKILKDRNLDLRHYYTELLKRRIALRLNSLKLSSYTEYMRFLDANPREYDRMFATLCINVSEFFRDPPVWVTMRCLLENLVNSKLKAEKKQITIWSAGCANGEEAFSLAILLREITRLNPCAPQPRIYATDIDKVCLQSCEKAEYPKTSLTNVDPRLMAAYFTRSGQNFRPQPEIRQLVAFSYLDLTASGLIPDTDLVVCRNVFIYFDHELQKKVLSKFCESLRPGGFLVMGKTELLPSESSCAYEEIDGNARIYRKK